MAPAPAAYPEGWYPGYWAGRWADLAGQYYGRAIPYNMYANFVNTNTGFSLPYAPLPGITGGL